ncbi:hypothetical protein [Microbacterium sp. PM5]|uniref:hypothetical protein n=1 Tax=Microbacterium sp. PM5 TaxID=2014534 RepID=UPI0013AEA9AB|nr:hypothetical protein [Microbacterium sp. PM5]
MDWFFDGLGTMIIGLIVGAAGGSAVTWRVMTRRQSQTQRAGRNSKLMQAGGDIKDARQ